MKISILIPENLVQQVHNYLNESDKSESIITALKDWVALRDLENNKKLKERDLEYLPGFEGGPPKARQ